MTRLLIAHSSELLADMLVQRLQEHMELCVCHDGSRVLELLRSFRPDAMILDLHLPRKDGLSILRQSGDLPRFILGTTGYCSFYVQQMAYLLGVQQLMLMPSVGSVEAGLTRLLEQDRDPLRKPDAPEQARILLRELNFSSHLKGSRQLAVALPLFAADPRQGVSKELYPAVAQIMACSDWRAVERSIRTAIQDAWNNREEAAWAKYFPEAADCPNNKRFLCRLAEMIEI